ncbi:hypothetical protein LTR94_031349, partial [Friedmanniomyces endolithicus]
PCQLRVALDRHHARRQLGDLHRRGQGRAGVRLFARLLGTRRGRNIAARRARGL